ncbi:MAG: MerR family transcriptional regulator [Bacteroidales bacterium]|nr:MerR family transcriptional regulator [Bacteroidales bacterium]
MELYSIKDLDKLSGIKAHTIRVWERRYKIVRPQRTGTNRRRYDDNDLRRIINISILRRNGFKISEIAKFSSSEIEQKVSFLSKDLFHSDTQIDSLVVLMVDHNEKGVNELLMRSMMNRGIEETMNSIVFPFLQRIGIMWQTGTADIGSEHYMTNIFRQKLIASIDALSPVSNPKGKRVILFLPENEFHEIGLLFFNYLIRKMGHDTLYLGQSTPLFSVVKVNTAWKADIIITGLIVGSTEVSREEYLLHLNGSFPKQKIFVAGGLAETAVKLKLPNVSPLWSAADLNSFL